MGMHLAERSGVEVMARPERVQQQRTLLGVALLLYLCLSLFGTAALAVITIALALTGKAP